MEPVDESTEGYEADGEASEMADVLEEEYSGDE